MTKKATGTAIVKLANDGKAFGEAIGKAHTALKRLIGSDDMARKVAAVTFTLVRRTPDLQECSIESIINGMLQSSQYGLELGTEAHLVPFYNKEMGMKEATFIPDWKGLVRLAIRAGAITRGHGDLVYKQDEFVYRRTGDAVEFLHEPVRFGKRALKDTVEAHREAGCQGVYFIGYSVTGPPVVAALNVDEVEYVRQTYSRKSKEGHSTPLWAKRWSAGAIKTAAKQALKAVPQSQDLKAVIEIDNRHETGMESGVLNGDVERLAPYQEPKAIAPAESTDDEVRREEQQMALDEQGEK